MSSNEAATLSGNISALSLLYLTAGLAVARTVERDYGDSPKLRRVDVLIERLRNKGIALNNEEMRECIQSLN